jgi:hypothetical protein
VIVDQSAEKLSDSHCVDAIAGGLKRRAHPVHWKAIRRRHMVVITFKYMNDSS